MRAQTALIDSLPPPPKLKKRTRKIEINQESERTVSSCFHPWVAAAVKEMISKDGCRFVSG
jgi:hypothetical protein